MNVAAKPDASASLLARLERLEARAAIEALMQVYADAADDKYTALRAKKPQTEIDRAAASQAACFAEDAVWSGGEFGGDLRGRTAIEAFFRRSPWRFTAHHYDAPLVRIGGATAEGTWRLIEIGIDGERGRTLLLSGRVLHTYRKTAEGWRIASMGFERLHAIVLATAPNALRCLIPAGESL